MRKRGVVHVENPRDYVNVPECDVVVAINVHPDVLVELPEIGCFKALIVPACNQNWCLPGLRRQLKEKCEEVGVDFASPKPFCNFESKGLMKKFCDEFKIGKPEFKVKVDGNKIAKAEVVVSDPCGSAYFVARRMRGYIIQDFQEFWKEIHQLQCAYPCMASMDRDPELIEAPFHLAGYIMVYRFSKAAGIDASEFVPEYFREFVR